MLFVKYFLSRISQIFLVEVSYITLYLMSCVKQDLMMPHAVQFILFQIFSEVSFGFSSKCRASSRFDAGQCIHNLTPSHSKIIRAIKLYHINFLLGLINLGHILSNRRQAQCEKLKENKFKLDKDRIFTSE